jgi:hypothetical protein
MGAESLGLLVAGTIAGVVGGVLVYAIDRAFSRHQEHRRHPA